MTGLTLQYSTAGSAGADLLERNVDTIDEALEMVAKRKIAKPATLLKDGRRIAKLQPCGEATSRFWRVE